VLIVATLKGSWFDTFAIWIGHFEHEFVVASHRIVKSSVSPTERSARRTVQLVLFGDLVLQEVEDTSPEFHAHANGCLELAIGMEQYFNFNFQKFITHLRSPMSHTRRYLQMH